MTCQTCQRESTAVAIGTSHYCALCGSRIEAAGAAQMNPVTPRPAPKSMDIGRASGAPVVSARGTSARKLHKPVTGAKSMDMRGPAKPVRPVRLKAEPATEPELLLTATTQPKTQPHIAEIKSVPRARSHGHESVAVTERLERAKQVPLSAHISRFTPAVSPAASVAASEPAPVVTPEPIRIQAPIEPLFADVVVPAAAITAHTSLVKLAAKNLHETPAPRQSLKWTQFAGAGAAVVVMAGYIWAQNYPKLTIQAAAAKAGVAATAPSYLPTSYSLATTSTGAGALTLNFKSPSEPAALTIGQSKTTWDTKSLLDNYVAKADGSYSAINGQGLTIYLFSDNQAAWVNHGIQYTIKGTARLSRDQVLKIAYGL